MSLDSGEQYVSRAGTKLAHGLSAFEILPRDRHCADLGSSTGGFVDCLLQHGAARVYAVERGYGVVHYRLRSDPRVVVMERTDMLHLRLPEPVGLVTIDAGWTRQDRVLPVAGRVLGAGGDIVTLVKTHYEADPSLLRGGILPDVHVESVLRSVRACTERLGFVLLGETESPIRGRAGNREFLLHLRPSAS